VAKKVGDELLLDAGAWDALRRSLETFAPDLIGGEKPAATVEKKKVAAPTNRDQYTRGVTPKQAYDDETVSSVQQRQRKGSGMSMHELMAKQIADPESVLPAEPMAVEGSVPSECGTEQFHCDEDELTGRNQPAVHYDVDELLEDPNAGGYEPDLDPYQPAEDHVADMLLEDAILDAYRDNMEASAAAIGTRGFANELHYYEERNIYDLRKRLDEDEGSERRNAIESDRAAAEAQRRADDDARRRMEDDAARRRRDDDLNRR
jgi:hypothetical protein